MLKRFVLTLISAVLIFSATAAEASKKVRSPYVTEGQWALEHFGTYGFDKSDSKDGVYKSKVALGYGVTDWWKVEFEAVIEDAVGDELTYKASEIVNKFQLTEKGEYWLDAGLYTAYEFFRDSNRADKVEAKILLAKPMGDYTHFVSIDFDREVGDNASDVTEGGLNYELSYKYSDDWKFGGEYFSDYGDLSSTGSWSTQSHQVGPYAKYYIPGTQVELQLGWLFGISSGATDHELKWELEYKF